MSIDRGVDKDVNTQWNITPIKRSEIMSFSATWMDLEIIILSELSQIKTNIMMLLICNLFMRQTNSQILKINRVIKRETWGDG